MLMYNEKRLLFNFLSFYVVHYILVYTVDGGYSGQTLSIRAIFFYQSNLYYENTRLGNAKYKLLW